MTTKLPEADIKRTTWSSDVYEPSDDSFALVDAVHSWLRQQSSEQQLPRTCLEVGCGSGFVICSVALAIQHLSSSGGSCTCSFLATDISPAALAATAATLQAHHVCGVELVQADLADSVLPRLAGAVDLLLFNPPYVPTPDEEVQRDGIARAWAGGHLGRRVTDRLLAQLPQLLAPQGHAFVVTVPENRPHEIMSSLEELGFVASIALTRAADEECLQILHISRKPPAQTADTAVT